MTRKPFKAQTIREAGLILSNELETKNSPQEVKKDIRVLGKLLQNNAQILAAMLSKYSSFLD